MSVCIPVTPEAWHRRVSLKKPVKPFVAFVEPAPPPFRTQVPPTRKSALRLPTCTDTLLPSKTVTFDMANLERVCLFNTSHRPSELRQSQPSVLVDYKQWPVEDPDRKATIKIERSLQVDNAASTISGHLFVLNLAYEKVVHIRYSLNNWKTVQDATAVFDDQENSGYDRFRFTLDLFQHQPRHTIQFAIRYRVAGQEYWDNNNGQNYKVVVHSPGSSSSTPSPRPTLTLHTHSRRQQLQSLVLPPPRALPWTWTHAQPKFNSGLTTLTHFNAKTCVNLVNSECYYSTNATWSTMTTHG